MRTAPMLAVAFLTACSANTPREPAADRPADDGRTRHHEAKGALGPYSALVEVGDLVFVAGRLGATKAEFEEEVATAIGAVEVELRRAGCTLADLVQVTCYLSDIALYERFNRVYAEKVPQPWPARAVVGVAGLPAGAHVEIVALARKP